MFFKTCSKCQKELPITSFYKNKTSPDGFQGYCKECMKKVHREYQIKHPQKMRDYAKRHWYKYSEEKKNGERVRMDNTQVFLDSLKTKCVKCGEGRVYVIQFHHKDPSEKKFNVVTGARSHKSKEDIVEEVKKCICLCANCHKEFHYFYGQKPKNPLSDLDEYLKKGAIEDVF